MNLGSMAAARDPKLLSWAEDVLVVGRPCGPSAPAASSRIGDCEMGRTRALGTSLGHAAAGGVEPHGTCPVGASALWSWSGSSCMPRPSGAERREEAPFLPVRADPCDTWLLGVGGSNLYKERSPRLKQERAEMTFPAKGPESWSFKAFGVKETGSVQRARRE